MPITQPEQGCWVQYGVGSKTNPDECVLFLQRALNYIISAGLAEDGVFGTNTYNAVMSYQRAKSLVVDGIAGDDTFNAIYDDLQNNRKVAVTYPATKTTMTPPVIPITTAPATVISNLFSGINWTTVGIIAAVALAAYFIFGQGGGLFTEEKPRRKRRRR